MVGLGTIPTDFYVALCTAQPGTGWDGSVLASVEPVDTAYSRKALLSGTSGWTLSPNGYVINAVSIDFGVPTVDWGVITHYALLDAATNGNLLLFGEYALPIHADTSFDVQIPQGGIVIALANLVASIAA